MSRPIFVFTIRWIFNSLGLWLAVQLLGSGYENIEVTAGTTGFLLAGLIFSIVNSILRPVAIVLSLPAILLTLGLFILIVNGAMVYLSLKIAPDISMSFFNSILTGIMLSLINYIVSTSLISKSKSVF